MLDERVLQWHEDRRRFAPPVPARRGRAVVILWVLVAFTVAALVLCVQAAVPDPCAQDGLAVCGP
jgi:hypothetical protein